jgi:hypothetical protein
MSVTSVLSMPRGLRRIAVVVATAAMVSAPGAALTAADAAKPNLPTPTQIVISNVAQRSLDLNIGGSTTKNYDVYVNGDIRFTNVPSSSSVPVHLLYLQPGTTYSIRVAQRVNLSVSPLSAPVTVTTLPGPTVAPITNLRVVSTATVNGIKTVTIAWDASSTPGNVWYDISLNGVGNQATSLTSAVVGESLNCYPGPCVGTGPKSGNNVITVTASANIDGFQVYSAPVSISFTL